MQFIDWAKVEFENVDDETFDKDRFNAISNEEFNNIISSLTEEEFISMVESSTWSNILEKWAYVIAGMLQEGLENSLEKYNDESYEVKNMENTDGNNIEENTENIDENEENTDSDNTEVENVDVFTESEKNDIEQILDILE